jgi:hypothetical protein
MAQKCVKPPEIAPKEAPPTWSNYGRTGPPREPGDNNIKTPATYPNNIPLGTQVPGRDELTCYGCLGVGHRISDCAAVTKLLSDNIVKYHEDTH